MKTSTPKQYHRQSPSPGPPVKTVPHVLEGWPGTAKSSREEFSIWAQDFSLLLVGFRLLSHMILK